MGSILALLSTKDTKDIGDGDNDGDGDNCGNKDLKATTTSTTTMATTAAQVALGRILKHAIIGTCREILQDFTMVRDRLMF